MVAVILILVSILLVAQESLGQTSLPLITLDKEEYNQYDKVIVTLNAPEKNGNPTQADTLVISLANQSGPLGTIRLFETGQDSGIFEGSFIITPDMARFPGDVSVSKGDHILLSFQPDKDNEIVKEVFVRFAPESQFPDPIKIPFSQNELVVIGSIVSQEKIPSRNQTIYNIKVEEYLKNPKPYDMITAFGDGTNQNLPYNDEVTNYNRPIFDVGNKVFVYLKKENSTFKISPYSFALSKNEFLGPPTNAWPTGPSKFEFEFNEPITISGIVKKAYLYDAEKRGENTTAYVKIYNPNNELYASELLETKLDGTFGYQVKIRGKLGIDGLYNYDIGLPYPNFQGGFFIKPFQLSPLKQFKSGVPAEQVKCKEDLYLIFKSTNEQPACVKSQTALKLIERKWASESLIQKTWVEIDPIQCGANPWEQDWIKSHPDDNFVYARVISKEKIDIITNYYKKLGIMIFDTKLVPWENTGVCGSCSCPAGYTQSLLVSNSDVDNMIENGYKISGNFR